MRIARPHKAARAGIDIFLQARGALVRPRISSRRPGAARPGSDTYRRAAISCAASDEPPTPTRLSTRCPHPCGDGALASSCVDDTVTDADKTCRQLSAFDRLHQKTNLSFLKKLRIPTISRRIVRKYRHRYRRALRCNRYFYLRAGSFASRHSISPAGQEQHRLACEPVRNSSCQRDGVRPVRQLSRNGRVSGDQRRLHSFGTLV